MSDPVGYRMTAVAYPVKQAKPKHFPWRFLGANQDGRGQWWICWQVSPNESVCIKPDVGVA